MGCNKIPYSSRGDGTLVRMLLAGVCGHFLLVGRPSKWEEYISKYVWVFFVLFLYVCLFVVAAVIFLFQQKDF